MLRSVSSTEHSAGSLLLLPQPGNSLKAYVNGNCRFHLIYTYCLVITVHCLISIALKTIIIIWCFFSGNFIFNKIIEKLFQFFQPKVNVVTFTQSWLEAVTGEHSCCSL